MIKNLSEEEVYQLVEELTRAQRELVGLQEDAAKYVIIEVSDDGKKKERKELSFKEHVEENLNLVNSVGKEFPELTVEEIVEFVGPLYGKSSENKGWFVQTCCLKKISEKRKSSILKTLQGNDSSAPLIQSNKFISFMMSQTIEFGIAKACEQLDVALKELSAEGTDHRGLDIASFTENHFHSFYLSQHKFSTFQSFIGENKNDTNSRVMRIVLSQWVRQDLKLDGVWDRLVEPGKTKNFSLKEFLDSNVNYFAEYQRKVNQARKLVFGLERKGLTGFATEDLFVNKGLDSNNTKAFLESLSKFRGGSKYTSCRDKEEFLKEKMREISDFGHHLFRDDMLFENLVNAACDANRLDKGYSLFNKLYVLVAKFKSDYVQNDKTTPGQFVEGKLSVGDLLSSMTDETWLCDNSPAAFIDNLKKLDSATVYNELSEDNRELAIRFKSNCEKAEKIGPKPFVENRLLECGLLPSIVRKKLLSDENLGAFIGKLAESNDDAIYWELSDYDVSRIVKIAFHLYETCQLSIDQWNKLAKKQEKIGTTCNAIISALKQRFLPKSREKQSDTYLLALKEKGEADYPLLPTVVQKRIGGLYGYINRMLVVMGETMQLTKEMVDAVITRKAEAERVKAERVAAEQVSVAEGDEPEEMMEEETKPGDDSGAREGAGQNPEESASSPGTNSSVDLLKIIVPTIITKLKEEGHSNDAVVAAVKKHLDELKIDAFSIVNLANLLPELEDNKLVKEVLKLLDKEEKYELFKQFKDTISVGDEQLKQVFNSEFSKMQKRYEKENAAITITKKLKEDKEQARVKEKRKNILMAKEKAKKEERITRHTANLDKLIGIMMQAPSVHQAVLEDGALYRLDNTNWQYWELSKEEVEVIVEKYYLSAIYGKVVLGSLEELAGKINAEEKIVKNLISQFAQRNFDELAGMEDAKLEKMTVELARNMFEKARKKWLEFISLEKYIDVELMFCGLNPAMFQSIKSGYLAELEVLREINIDGDAGDQAQTCDPSDLYRLLGIGNDVKEVEKWQLLHQRLVDRFNVDPILKAQKPSELQNTVDVKNKYVGDMLAKFGVRLSEELKPVFIHDLFVSVIPIDERKKIFANERASAIILSIRNQYREDEKLQNVFLTANDFVKTKLLRFGLSVDEVQVAWDQWNAKEFDLVRLECSSRNLPTRVVDENGVAVSYTYCELVIGLIRNQLKQPASPSSVSSAAEEEKEEGASEAAPAASEKDNSSRITDFFNKVGINVAEALAVFNQYVKYMKEETEKRDAAEKETEHAEMEAKAVEMQPKIFVAVGEGIKQYEEWFKGPSFVPEVSKETLLAWTSFKTHHGPKGLDNAFKLRQKFGFEKSEDGEIVAEMSNPASGEQSQADINAVALLKEHFENRQFSGVVGWMKGRVKHEPSLGEHSLDSFIMTEICKDAALKEYLFGEDVVQLAGKEDRRGARNKVVQGLSKLRPE